MTRVFGLVFSKNNKNFVFISFCTAVNSCILRFNHHSAGENFYISFHGCPTHKNRCRCQWIIQFFFWFMFSENLAWQFLAIKCVFIVISMFCCYCYWGLTVSPLPWSINLILFRKKREILLILKHFAFPFSWRQMIIYDFRNVKKCTINVDFIIGMNVLL